MDCGHTMPRGVRKKRWRDWDITLRGNVTRWKRLVGKRGTGKKWQWVLNNLSLKYLRYFTSSTFNFLFLDFLSFMLYLFLVIWMCFLL